MKRSISMLLLYICIGLVLYFIGSLLFLLTGNFEQLAIAYMLITGIGFLSVLSGGTLISRFIMLRLKHDVFNELNETFPQEERLLQNEFSINLPARYNLKGKIRNSWINIINPFRSLLAIGSKLQTTT